MPKATVFQDAFNGGEFSPMAQGRVDSARYKTGLNACLNYIPTLQGPLLRRPGTKFVKSVTNPSGNSAATPPALIPFIFSQTQAYMLEFGQQYINFYSNNGGIIALPAANNFQLAGATSNTLQNFFFASRPVYAPKNGETIVSSSVLLAGNPLWVPSPYQGVDVAALKWAQNADSLYLTHPSYPTFKLQRFGNYDWRLMQVYYQDGPYLANNSYRQTGDSTFVTLQPGGNGWAGVAGAATTLQTGPHVTIAGAGGLNASSGPIVITTTSPHGYPSGQQVVVKNVVGTSEANTFTISFPLQPSYWTARVLDPSRILLEGSTYTNRYTSGGDIYPSLFTGPTDVNKPLSLQQGNFNNAGQRMWGVITSYLGDNSTVGFTIDASNTLFNTSVVLYWQIGCFGGPINFGGTFSAAGSTGSSSYPSAICFHQNRMCVAGSPNFPQQVDGSQIGLPESFSPTVLLGSTALQVLQTNAFQFNLASTDVNILQWLKSTQQGLLSASYSNEWCITPSSQASALSPSNVNAQQTSFFGAANVDAVSTGNAVLYVQRAQRKLREMHYFFQVGTYRSTDLTEISEHITLPTITKLAVQKETQPLVWAIRADGNLVSMTYNRDDLTLQAGWARHQLGGRSDSSGTNPIVSSIGVIPDSTGVYDQMWMITKRYLQTGTTVFCVEYLTNTFNDGFLQEDAVQGDCGQTYDVPINIGSISNAAAAVITSPFHGLNNGDQIQIVGVVGVNTSVVDVNGNVTTTNLVNYKTFIVGSSASFTLNLLDNNSVPINSLSYSAFVALGTGIQGKMRKLVTTISGLSQFAGETFNILADGKNHPATLVGSGGILTLQYPAAKVQIGYAFNSDGQLLRPNAGSAEGSAIGSTRRVHRAAVMLHSTGDWAWGLTFNNLIAWNFTQADVNLADTAVPLFTGIIRDGVEAPYDFDGQICFRQNSMLPGMVQGIVTFMEEFDV